MSTPEPQGQDAAQAEDELVPLEAHIVALRADLLRTRQLVAVAGAGALLGVLLALWASRGGAS